MFECSSSEGDIRVRCGLGIKAHLGRKIISKCLNILDYSEKSSMGFHEGLDVAPSGSCV